MELRIYSLMSEQEKALRSTNFGNYFHETCCLIFDRDRSKVVLQANASKKINNFSLQTIKPNLEEFA